MHLYTIKGWTKFQHYKKRNPPWVKLHFSLLSSEDWVSLDDASRVLAIACMLIASRNEGKIDGSEKGLAYLKRVAYLNKKPDLNPLILCGFLECDSESKQMLADARPETETETETETEKPIVVEKQKSTRFTPPSVHEVTAYCSERQNSVNPQQFVDHYTSNGWKVGKNPMKDWRAAIRTWERNSGTTITPSHSEMMRGL